ncbi:glycosyltransferase family 4 protein [Gillisia sp. JM1]|uniref:glycosyltransferase family 4 protein n=1 Tax=Gillisia sp. JM1 TaxID=1283286 RepID=UPI0003F81F28|nr:glycosyltransferase family 4 protein [Gillisia sp. JM1]
MNILFITHYSALYGANKSLINLLEGLKQHGAKPFVVIPEKGDLGEFLENKNIPYLIHQFNWWCGIQPQTTKNKYRNLIFKVEKWKKNIKRKKFNNSQVSSLKLKLGNFNPDFIHSNSSVFNFGLLYAKKYNIPHIWHLRESQEQYCFKWFYNTKFVNKTFNKSDIIISVSSFLKEYYSRKNNINNIKVLYNGVSSCNDLLKLDELRKLKTEKIDEALVFGIVGLLHPKKGQEEAIKSFAMVNKNYPKTRLIIVGEGDQNRLRKLVEELKLTDRVEFWGHVSDPFNAFLAMDVCLMCSRMEGMGRVTIEAMATAIPVIGYREGGTVELIEENITGLFYEIDHNQLAEKMIYLIKNREQRIKMGMKARKIFEKKYTSEIYAQNFMNIITNFKK